MELFIIVLKLIPIMILIFEVLDLMSKDESDTVSPDKVTNID